ncbi:MAG: hypothetical protein ACYDHH_04150 [Solirubrobacteraceae bacterium]
MTNPDAPYVPRNRPAVGDLFDMFDFRPAQADLARVAALKQPARLPRLRGGWRTGGKLVHIPNSQR